ncbi:glycosyltransferase [Pseudoalteromonas sp. Z9A5]|uniref:glycosyltransferase family 2 protein n=1 Tax=Pseudoalteromonas sp. Z9A5 TaxID=2686355 RepID=UPI001407DDE0|nr:glycosyltransferase [Pseudoalteromonas sp. Z9A5]
MISLSIIIPVYNGEEYLTQALGSIVDQIDNQSEVIIINDGSTDNSLSIINNNYKNEIDSGLFKVIDQANAGVSVARNNGIKQSVGEYITFIDADDFILPGYFLEIQAGIKAHPVDVLEMGYIPFINKSDVSSGKACYSHNTFGLVDSSTVISSIFSRSLFYPFLRVIKRSFFDNNLFPVGIKFCEDLILLQNIYRQSKHIYHIEKPLYAYRLNPNGATGNVKPEYITGMLSFYTSLLGKQEVHIMYLKANIFYVIYKAHENLNLKINLSPNIRKDSLKLLWTLLWDNKITKKRKFIIFSPNLFYLLRKIIKGSN